MELTSVSILLLGELIADGASWLMCMCVLYAVAMVVGRASSTRSFEELGGASGGDWLAGLDRLFDG